MGLLLAGYLVGLVLHGHGLNVLVDGWLGMLAVSVPAVLCCAVVRRDGFRRPEVPLAAIAATAFAAGNAYRIWSLSTAGTGPFPSPADVGFLMFYPLMLTALAVAVRRRLRGLARSVWLDSAVGSLGASAVLVVVLHPLLDSAITGSPTLLATCVAVAYPIFDLMLLATVAAIPALLGVRIGGQWTLLFVGLLTFAAADVIYALRVNENAYVVGTPLDAMWGVGLALMALWIYATDSREGTSLPPPTGAVTGNTALVVPMVATVSAVGVLVVSSHGSVSFPGVALATATLVAAATRTHLAFRQLRRMADLRVQATTDELTGLPNRRALYAAAHLRMLEPQGRRLALLMMDLDKFKEVNDSLGHHAGDLLLIQVGARLREQLRDGDVLARLGGDEFAVLLDDAGQDEAVEVAIKLRAALDAPFAVENIALHSCVSVGISLFPDDGPDLAALLRKADIAMYEAKTSLRGHHVYCGADDADHATRLQTVEELRTALREDQLVVHYQPKIDLDTGEVHSVEALVRWDHPTRGLLYPDAFLHLVEESGLMPTLTRVVLSLVLDQVADWHAHGRQLTAAVNLSASSLVDSDLPAQVASMLAARGVPPQALQLEITEDFLMGDRDRARSILSLLRESGVQISIDDFGTGYSSLSYLRDLPIDELKLDRSFIFPMADDARAAALVASTIALAHSLNLRMVAEGVETEVAYSELQRLGCDQAQGYFMSRPVPAAELDHWLESRRSEAATRPAEARALT
jgi:diguanylate cyclase (GGDEF)-like protein